MRPLLVLTPLLFIFLLATPINGIRVERGYNPAIQNKFNEIHILNEGENVLTNAGMARKLLTKPPIVSNKEKNKKEESSTSQEDDILDINGMDYSPAKRKPPIHN